MSYRQNDVLIPESSYIRFNDVQLKKYYFNDVLVWQRQQKVYPGIPVAKTQNLGYGPYFTVTNNGSDIKVDAFGGTERGWGRAILGPFSSIGYSKLYFSALRAYITNAFSKVSVSLGDINCCFSKRMRKLFIKNEKSVLRFCNKSSKTKRAFTKVLMPCKRPF